jgi:glycosyltransferase involved in cell wall biosynthesis
VRHYRSIFLGDTLKVLFITAWYPTRENPIDGIFIREHAKSVSIYANEVTVIHAGRTDKRTKGIYRIFDTIEEGIRTIRIYCFPSPFRPINYISYSWAILVVARKLFKKGFFPEIIHAHVYTAGLPALILARWYRIPIVLSEHWSRFPLRKLNVFEKILAKLVMNRVDMILPVSNSLKMTLRGCGIKGRFKVVPNVVDTSLFYPPEKNQKIHDDKKILFVGSLKPVKGLPYLFDALSELGRERIDWHLDIVGEGAAREEYEQMVVRLGLDHKIKFHGLRTKREVSGFMRQADFFVLPSLWENLPCVIIEAMASGLPIVSTDVGGIPELINAETGILVPPGNVTRLSEALGLMTESLHQYDRFRIAQKAQRYSMQAIGKLINSIYENCLLQR